MHRYILTAILILLSCSILAQDDDKVIIIEIIPEKVVLHPGEQFQFKARGKNRVDRIVSSFTPEWSSTGGYIDKEGKFTAGNNAGMYAVMASEPRTGAQGSASVEIQFVDSEISVSGGSKIASLSLIPRKVELSPGGSIRFTVQAFNAQGKRMRLPSRLIWNVQGGSIKAGMYQAGGTPGAYTVKVKIPSGVSTASKVSIKGALGTVVNIKVTPSSSRLKPFSTQRFWATGYDSAGKRIPFQPVWEATGGSIDQNGIYQAGSVSGTYFVRASGPGHIAGTTSVKIQRMDLDRIEIDPQSAVLVPGQVQMFKVRAYDKRGKELPVSPSWSATGGVIQANGVYRAGRAPGNYLLKVSVGKITSEIPIRIAREKRKQQKQIVITPDKVILEPGQSIHFSAGVYDLKGRELALAVKWEARGGQINGSGLYKAGKIRGRYQVKAYSGNDAYATAQVIIAETQKTEADYVVIKPRTVKLKPGERMQFKAKALAQGMKVAATIIWEAQGGEITDDGLYTAGHANGKFLVTAKTSSGVQARGPCTVIIQGKAKKHGEHRLQVRPGKITLHSKETQKIKVSLINPKGKKISGKFRFEASGGKIDAKGNYTAGDMSGKYSIVVVETTTGLSEKIIVHITAKTRKYEPVKIERWKVGGGTKELGRIHINGMICDENAYLLQLVLFENNGSRKVLSQRSVSTGETFECKGAYVRKVTKTIGIVLYDRKLNAIYTFQKAAPSWPK